MVRHRPDVPQKLRKQLRNEAGGKCANPGCDARRTQLHHIREWHVYETHEAAHMIAVCPNCHDAIHHGQIELSDDTVYQWKRIQRSFEEIREHLYVEPGTPLRLLLGSLAFQTRVGTFNLFETGSANQLRFQIADEDILQLVVRVLSTDGKELIRVTDNHIRTAIPPDCDYVSVPGHFALMAPVDERYCPATLLGIIRHYEPDFGESGSVPLLHVEVVRPGVVRVRGLWMERDRAVVVTEKHVGLARSDGTSPLFTKGQGESSLIIWNGRIDGSVFRLIESGGITMAGVRRES